jgi:hypothetical protein
MSSRRRGSRLSRRSRKAGHQAYVHLGSPSWPSISAAPPAIASGLALALDPRLTLSPDRHSCRR